MYIIQYTYIRYSYYTIYIMYILRNARTKFRKFFSKLFCILLNLNPYYTSYPNPYLNQYINHTLSFVIPALYFHHTPYILCIPSNLDIPLVTALLGPIHKRRPQYFAYFQPPLSALSLPLLPAVGVRIHKAKSIVSLIFCGTLHI